MSSAGRARLFVAVEVPREARAVLSRWGGAACAHDPALRPVRTQALHVTLHFLGERPEGHVEALRAVIAGGGDGVVPLVAGGALWLAPRRPHVLTCALQDRTGALGALHSALGPALAAATPGWSAEGRALRPHVTVARVRRGARPLVGAEPDAPSLAFTAPALVLMRSDLAPAGAVYETLERRPLRTDA